MPSQLAVVGAALCLCILQAAAAGQPEGFADLQDCVHRAALLSTIVYKDSANAVREVVQQYEARLPFDFVYTSHPDEERVGHKVVLARNNGTLYMCFRGSHTISDFFVNIRVRLQELTNDEDLGAMDGGVRGLYHAGFADSVRNQVPMMRFLRTVVARHVEYGSGRLVFCGHSLGGAVAHLALVKYLISTAGSGKYPKRAIAIAFGAPLFGNQEARNELRLLGWEERLYNYVGGNDPVPYLSTTFRRRFKLFLDPPACWWGKNVRQWHGSWTPTRPH